MEIDIPNDGQGGGSGSGRISERVSADGFSASWREAGRIDSR